MRDNLIIQVHPKFCEWLGQSQTEIKGRWYPSRPEGFASIWYRIKATWLVWTGRADALVWPCGQ